MNFSERYLKRLKKSCFWWGLFSLLLLAGFSVHGGSIPLEITVSDGPGRKLYLLDFTGYKSRIIDSAMTDGVGKATFNNSGNAYEGMYRLLLQRAPTLAEQKFLDLFYAGQPIKIATTLRNPDQDTRFLTDGFAAQYRQWNNQMGCLARQENVLRQTLADYPVRDGYLRQSEKQLAKIRKEQNRLKQDLVKAARTNATARLQLARWPLIFGPEKAPANLSQWADFYFKNVNFSDPIHYRYNHLPDLIVAYFQKVKQLPVVSEAEQLKRYQEFVSTVLEPAKANQPLYQILTDFLTLGFEQMENLPMLSFMRERFAGNLLTCENEERARKLEQKIAALEAVAIGKPAPALRLPGLNGETVSLQQLSGQRMLVLFWASWCSHCTRDVPALTKLTRTFDPQKLSVLAISLDTDKAAWQNFVQKEATAGNWFHASDLRGWNSIAADVFAVAATPAMFLLDEHKQIIARPQSLEELRQLLGQL